MHILLPTVLLWGLKIIAYIFCLNVSVSCILWRNFRVIYLRQVSIKYVFTLAFILIFFRETKLFANYCFFTKQVYPTMLRTKLVYHHKILPSIQLYCNFQPLIISSMDDLHARFWGIGKNYKELLTKSTIELHILSNISNH